MSYVGEPFEYDIFISHAHGNKLLKQWSQGFAEQLECELQSFLELKDHVKIFFDTSRKPDSGIHFMDPLTPAIREAAESSAILAIIMTPSYLESSWCRLEREVWFESIERVLKPSGNAKLSASNFFAIARAWRTTGTWPNELLDLFREEPIGIFFYDNTLPDTQPQPYSWPFITSETGPPFRKQLTEFTGSLREKLHLMQDELAKIKAYPTNESGQDILREFLEKNKMSIDELNDYLKATGRDQVNPSSKLSPSALRSILLLDQLCDAGALGNFFDKIEMPIDIPEEPVKEEVVIEETPNRTTALQSKDDLIHLNIYGNDDKEEN